MSELLEGSLIDASAALDRGDVSAVELCRAALDRIEASRTTLGMVISLRADAALAQAEAIDRRRSTDEPLGALAGIPLMHKDMFYRRGEVTTCGSAIRREWRATTTATVVERLDGAGALDLGRLNMAEFAVGLTGHNVHYGDCRNPWTPAHITGGSSSGSGAVTAARCVFGALGSDTGGSIRLPATVNGVVGLKPTQTRVSRAGAMPLSPSLDCIGPLARRVADAARLYDVIAGADTRDPTSSHRTVPSAEAACRQGARAGLDGVRVGVARTYFEDDLDPEVAALLSAARRQLEALGADIVEIDTTDVAAFAQLQTLLMGGEASTLHFAWLRDRFGEYSPQVRARLLPGLAYPATAYRLAASLRPDLTRAFIDATFARCDVLHTATLALPAPTLDETRTADGPEMAAMIMRLGRCTRPVSYLGLPALTVPMGFTANGLPSGCQLVGRPFGEARLFQVAGAYEAATGFHRQRPPFAAPLEPSRARP
ncbi:MAG: amidase [Pseudomonadota bacterium]